MDIEQLKLILETVKGVGDSALTVTAIWMARDFVLALLGYGLGFYVVTRIYRVLIGLVDKDRFTEALAAEINTCAPLAPHERRQILELIRKGKDHDK